MEFIFILFPFCSGRFESRIFLLFSIDSYIRMI